MSRLAASVKRPPAACVIFFADGLSQTVLQRMLAAGDLPNIGRLFARGGVEVENAIVCLPSLTYANSVSLITGLLPGHHGILGNQWFDPTTPQHRDYGGPLTYRRVNDDIRHATVYDLLDDHFTLNVQCHTRKGVKHTIDQDISSGILWGLGCYQTVDRRVGDVLPRVARVIESAGRWPIVWINYFPGVDEIGHRFGPDSSEYAAAVRNVDAQVARIAAFAQENAGVERLFLAFVTDHGMVATPTDRRVDQVEYFRQCGMGISSGIRGGPAPAFRSIRQLAAFEMLAFPATDRALRFHLRDRRGWDKSPSAEAVAAFRDMIPLQNIRTVGVVCSRTPNRAVHVEWHGGAATVERRISTVRAEYMLSDDLPQLQGTAPTSANPPSLAGKWRDSREWLSLTAATAWPDFVPQVVEMLDTHRAGDVVAFAADNWSFHPRFVAGHGSCLAADMRVSHFYAGPGLPPGGKVHAARLVDVMPTLLDLLGHHDRLARIPPIDGVSVRRELEAAGSV